MSVNNPDRSNRRVIGDYNRILYKQGNRIEGLLSHSKVNCTIANRYNRLANNW